MIEQSDMDSLVIENLLGTLNISTSDVIIPDGPGNTLFPSINRDIAKWIDQQLDWRDAVSFAFLMVEKVKIALELSKAIEENQQNTFQKESDVGIVQIINLSAEKNKAINWEVRVYQALYLLHHNLTLYKLGIAQEDADQHFEGGNHIKSERRLLYKLCEELEMKDQDRLVEFTRMQIENLPKTMMAETLLLHMMIHHNSETLCEIVKQGLSSMNRADLVNTFEKEKCAEKICLVHNRQSESEDDFYEQGMGLCVIINQKIFYADRSDPHATRLDDRLGTDRDRDELEATFTLFGADCIIHNDLDHIKLEEKLEEAAIQANNPKYFWVSVCVLSHGRRVNGVDEILGVNGIGMDRKKIINKFADASNCPNLSKKPKLFFFQACRGNETPQAQPQSRETVASDSAVPCTNGWPAISDYMVASATIEDFVSFRSTIEGSFFILHLCKALQKYGHEKALGDIMINVNKNVCFAKYFSDARSSSCFRWLAIDRTSLVNLNTQQP